MREIREFDKMLNIMFGSKTEGYTQLAKILNMSRDSVKNQCAPSKELPRWAVSMLYVWNGRKNNS